MIRSAISWAEGFGLGRAFALVSALVGMGCYSDIQSAFPPGLEPWEMTNVAPLPAPRTGVMFPEEITFVRRTFAHPSVSDPVPSVHARAYIQRPIAAVWEAVRDPQTGRDPTASDGFRVVAWAVDSPRYQFTYRTHITVTEFVTLEWDVDWRHGVIEGTSVAPVVTATRWQKTSGSSALEVLEGSLVLRAVAGQPNVTEVQYQYHLEATLSGHDTIERHLSSLYQRLTDRAHGRPLNPNDCNGCPPRPPGY